MRWYQAPIVVGLLGSGIVGCLTPRPDPPPEEEGSPGEGAREGEGEGAPEGEGEGAVEGEGEGAGDCRWATDCFGLPWPDQNCRGGWSCLAGRCEASCAKSCGDGWCDPRAETEVSCPDDCRIPVCPPGCVADVDCSPCDRCQSVELGEGLVCSQCSPRWKVQCQPGQEQDCPEGHHCIPFDPDLAECGGYCQEQASDHPQCATRQGTCVTIQEREDCPAGSHAPFSGVLLRCNTDHPSICCVQDGAIGSPCSAVAACSGSNICLDEEYGYPAGGLCTSICSPELGDCPDWAICLPVPFSQAMGMCLVGCKSADDCRAGWSCEPFAMEPWVGRGKVVQVCWQAGTGNAGAALGQECRSDLDCLSGWCTAAQGSPGTCTLLCDPAQACPDGYFCDWSGDCFAPPCGLCQPMP